MSNVHKLKLDISKGFINVNEPVGFRQGDGLGSTVIQAEVYDHGQPFTDLKSASFYCTKPDQKVVMNDPATVNGNKITYIINPQVGASSGKIERAFFLVNDSPISTENFQIKVLNGTRLAGDSTDYLPGFDQIQQEWQAKLEELRLEIKNIDLTEEITKAVNEGMNKVQADVNAKVQSTIDAINLKMKDLDATQESVNKAISDATNSIEKLKKLELEIDGWLEKEHQYVVDNVNKWKSEFDKQLSAEEKRLDTTDKAITSLNSRLDSISSSINDIDVPQINADVKKAKEDSAAALTTAKSKADKKDLETNYIKKNDIGNYIPSNIATIDTVSKMIAQGLFDLLMNKNITGTNSSGSTSTITLDQVVAMKTALANYLKTTDLKTEANKAGFSDDWYGSQAQYDALTSRSSTTNYNIWE